MRIWRPFGLLTRLFSSIFSPCSVPSTSSEVTLGPHSGGWKGLGLLLKVLDRSAGAFGPIKSVVTELIRCIEIYEVRTLTRSIIEADLGSEPPSDEMNTMLCAVNSSRYSKISKRTFRMTFHQQ